MARHSTDICYLPIYLPSCISLHLTKLTRTMQCCGYAYHGTVVLRIGLRAISSQKKSAQIGHVWPDKRGQFRVRATALGKRSWPGADQVAHGLIDGAIFFGSGHLLCSIEIESPLTPA